MATVISSENDITIEAYGTMFEMKNKQDGVYDTIQEEHLQHLVGRVAAGSSEVDFEYLQKDPHVKKFAWVMGNDGLMQFLKQSNIQALLSIGSEGRSIRKKLEFGNHFRLGVFYKSDQCVLGTWDGIFSLIDSYYPKSISTKIRRHADALKQMSYDQIESRARLSYLQGASYCDIAMSSVNGCSTDPRFMSEEKISECEGTLEECRGFLYHRLGLTKLFDGSGFTKDSNGQLHVREYLQVNRPVRDLSGFRYFNLPIDMNDLMPDV